MELNRENMKKIRELILFTAIVIVCLWKFNMVLQVLLKGLNIFIPFLLGGAIAFVLNVPMNFVERHLFSEDKRKGKRYMQKAARPCSMILVLIFVFGVVAAVMFVLVPQLGNTFSNLGKNVQIFLPHVQAWAKQVFHNNKEIMNIVNNIEFDWDKIMNTGIGFFKNGAGSVLDSTITAAKSIVSGVTTFFIAFVFAIYILLQKEKLEIQAKKVLFAFVRKGRAEAIIEVCSLTYKTFSRFYVCCCNDNFPSALCIADRNCDSIYCTDSDIWSICWVWNRSFTYFYGKSGKSSYFYRTVSCIAADRRKSYLSTCCWKFSGASVYLGTCSG